jgi:hypothetical protein
MIYKGIKMIRDLLLEYRIAKLEKMLKNEAKQVGTFYHVCTLKAYLEWIAPKDMLQASGKYYNWVYGGNDYVSFTRDKYFVVGTKSVQASKVLVQLVIDGDKLSENHKIGPYNDFAFGPNGEHVDDGAASKYREKEETCKGPIKNLSKYIKEIRIDVFDMDSSTLSMIRSARLDGDNVKYFHFIKGFQDKTFTAWMKENGVRDGMPLSEAMVKFKDYINLNKFNELLFSYDIDDVSKAIKLKADLNAEYPTGYILETYAEDDSNLDIVELCLSKGADPNLKMKNGWYPLMSAAEYDSPEICKALVESGAMINATNNDGDTALIIASKNKSTDAVKTLIELGANVNVENNYHETAADVATSKQIVSLLKKAAKRG